MEDQETMALHQEGHCAPCDENKIIEADAENPQTLEDDYDDDADVELMLPSRNLPDDVKVQNNSKCNF